MYPDVPLRERAAAKGILFGAAVAAPTLNDADFAAALARECNILVPEGALKMRNLRRPNPEDFYFEPNDRIIDFAESQGMAYRGHTLVWHHSIPDWFRRAVNRDNAERIFLDHIETVTRRYTGRIHSWDVVNEVLDVDSDRADGLRDTPWLRLLGPEYIDLAFHAAAEADPHALLVLNDYGLDYATERDLAKRDSMLRLLERLLSRGVPVHGLGLQGHLRGTERRFSGRSLQRFLEEVSAMGLKILVTELDVRDRHLPNDPLVRDDIVASIYRDYVSAVLDVDSTIAVITWGLTDRYTWLANRQPRDDGAPVRPLPLDSDMQRKQAWHSIAQAIDLAPSRPRPPAPSR